MKQKENKIMTWKNEFNIEKKAEGHYGKQLKNLECLCQREREKEKERAKERKREKVLFRYIRRYSAWSDPREQTDPDPALVKIRIHIWENPDPVQDYSIYSFFLSSLLYMVKSSKTRIIYKKNSLTLF